MRAFLADQDNPPPDGMRPEWSCIVRSPGGEEVHGSVEVEPGTSAAEVYRRFVALFEVDDPVRLWFSPGRSPARSVTPSPSELGIGLWDRSGTPIPQHDYAIGVAHQTPYCLAAHVEGRDEYFVEAPDPDGRPSFAVMRSDDLMLFDAFPRGERLRLYPRVVSKPGYHTAYWAFVRENWPDAAREAARRLVADDRVGDAAENALAAAHAIVRFREFWSFEPAVSRRLAGVPDSMDVRLTRWVLSFEKGEGNALDELSSLLGGFRAEKPVFAETFRLFYERLGPAVRRAAKRGIGGEEMESGEALVDRLADSSFMTGEHLVFRGRSPTEPDPDATRTEPSAQKKTSPPRFKGP